MSTLSSTTTTTTRRPVRRSAALALTGVLAGGLLASVTPSASAAPFASAAPAASAAAAPADAFGVDLSRTTGAFRGGATGTLYGLGDDGSPAPAVLAGARVTNTSQKPPNGLQHPNGDALAVERSFFAAGGQDLYVYAQDMYPDWSYNGGRRPGDANADGVWDYLPLLRSAVEKVATTSAHPEKYVFIPFNEPDGGNWYPDWATQKDQFLADWSTAYQLIQDVYAEHGLGKARIGGPGDAEWRQQRSADFLAYAKGKQQLPDVFIWHELGASSLANFPLHQQQYQTILRNLALPDIPVNITEYGALRDMGVPGQLVQWISMFEEAKVDAQTAYWNYAGNLSDNTSRNQGANGGWWMFKWYGDLAGAQTATATSPTPDVPDSLQGMAAVDEGARKATVLLGGGSRDVALTVSGLKATVFGADVDVVVRADRLNGAEGASEQPPVVVSTTQTVSDGKVSVTIPNSDRYTAYQVLVTPKSADRPAVDLRTVSSVEAESAQLTGASVFDQDPNRGFNFIASGNRDVGAFNSTRSAATWTVTAPRDGRYRLRVLAGTNAVPGKHALFVDGRAAGTVDYSATLNWGYRGTAETTVSLKAGTHQLSLRASADGTSVLPGADITLDRFDLLDVTDGDTYRYLASEARLSGGSTLSWSTAGPSAAVSQRARATFFPVAAETGYHDLTVEYSTTTASTVSIAVGSTVVPLPRAAGAGTWRSTVRVWLPQGVSQVGVSADRGAAVRSVLQQRGQAQAAEDTRPANAVTVQAEDLQRAGATSVRTIAASAGSNGDAAPDGSVRVLGGVGNGAGNTATLARPSGFGPGAYVLTLSASNADKTAAINYNPQVVDRFLDVTETGGASTRVTVRHNYSWNSFWDRSVPVTLTTRNGSLVLGNPTAFAPDLDALTLARLTVGTATTTAVPTTAGTTQTVLYQQVNSGDPVRANVGQPVQIVVQFGNRGAGVVDGSTLVETCRQTNTGSAGSTSFALTPAEGTQQQIARPYPAGQNANLTLVGTPRATGRAVFECTLSGKDQAGALVSAAVTVTVDVVR